MHAVWADLISIIVYCVLMHTSYALISSKLFWRHI